MYFSNFDSFQTAKTDGKSLTIMVERSNGETLSSSPIPMDCLAEVIEELEAVEQGGPVHLWRASDRSLIVVPSSQIASIQLVFVPAP